MKKYLYSALALPLLFACSSDDLFEKEAVSNDQFAGIEKVDATFSMDEPTTRFDGGVWDTEEGDVWGFAWLGDGANVAINGKAYQNHNLIQTSGIFTPQTSIYVGKYFLYRPYDKTTVSPQAINFKSLEEQPLAEGYESTTQAWKDLAKTAINIGDKWTNVTLGGAADASGKVWDKAGIKQSYNIYGALFSNQTGLDLTYTKNDPTFAADTKITGATDIDLTLKKGDKVGAAVIYGGTIQLDGAAKYFTYAPGADKEPVVAAAVTGQKHSGTFWADKSGASTYAVNAANGFTFTPGAITLKAGEAGVTTENKTKGWFWFNSLPNTDGTATEASVVTPIFETSYGTVTVKKSYDPETNYTVKDCAYALNVEGGKAVFHPLANAADATKTPTVWAIGANNTFINQYGNHKGKYSVNVDFSKGVMNGMHIKSDEHLQTALKYYIASGKTESPVVLNLDKEADGNFSISKISIALIQTIQNGGKNVKVQACGTAGHEPAKIIVTQKGSDGKTEVPALNNVFAAETDVYLANTTWTWTGGDDFETALPIDANVKSITNEGTLTVNATNIQLSVATTPAAPAAPTKYILKNAKGATMDITEVTTVKNALTNLGTINVGASAELRAYDVEIKNDATSLNDYGVINNAGVVGVTYATTGTVNNYGKIIMENSDAITLLTSNQTAAGDFDDAFNAGTNKLGTVVLPSGQPNALVSVSNGEETGFIEYTWTGGTSYSTPNGGTVKYNTLIVSDDIAFYTAENEIKYIKFDGVRKTVTNSTNLNLPNLKGIIVDNEDHNASIIIEKSNTISCSEGSHLGTGAAIYNGGSFTPGNTNIVGKTVTDYLGEWNTDQIVKY